MEHYFLGPPALEHQLNLRGNQRLPARSSCLCVPSESRVSLWRLHRVRVLRWVEQQYLLLKSGRKTPVLIPFGYERPLHGFGSATEEAQGELGSPLPLCWHFCEPHKSNEGLRSESFMENRKFDADVTSLCHFIDTAQVPRHFLPGSIPPDICFVYLVNTQLLFSKTWTFPQTRQTYEITLLV